MSESKKLSDSKEVVFVVLTLAVALALLYYTKATGVLFKSFVESDVLAIITSMFVVACFHGALDRGNSYANSGS
jgi:hypothetical protein